MSEEITEAQIAKHYVAMGHSVDLILAGQPEGMTVEGWEGMKSRNQEHLALMLAKEFWTDEDMTDVEAAIAA
jgi:hypothetical protein